MRVRYKDLSLQQLRTFRDVCRLGSYSRVAGRLQLSTSAVWEQVRGLERYFQLSLLEKRNGRIRPTPEGERLWELTSGPLSDLEAAKELLHQLGGRPPGKITLVSGMRILCEEAALAAARFREKYPEVTVRLWFVADSQINQLVERGEADFGLRHRGGRDREHGGLIRVEPAYDLDFLLITPPKHPLARKRSLRLEDVVRCPLVVSMEGLPTRRRVEEIFERRGLADRLTLAAETTSSVMTVAAVQAGVGVGIIAGNPQGVLTEGLGVRSLRKWFGRSRMVFVWRRGTIVPPFERDLADLIRSCAAGGK